MITSVAIKDINGKVWSLPRPNRHGHIFLNNKAKKIDNSPLVGGIQGFLDDTGLFLDRTEAFLVALKCGQLLPPYNPINPSQRKGEVNPEPRELFSEDIW